ncbi:MAG: ABC transporter permease [Candidatus Latescibacterota bacterium]
MIKNHLLIATRNLLRHKAYSFINILGLAIGLACCMLIMLYVQNEWQYDQYHTNKDCIYRVVRETRMEGDRASIHPGSSGRLVPSLLQDFPEIEHATRIWERNFWVYDTQNTNKGFYQWVAIVDPAIFDVFTIPLLYGNPATVFDTPETIVISETMSIKLFGNTNPIGQTLTLDHNYHESKPYRITGVMRDFPTQSSIQFDIMTATVKPGEPEEWWNQWHAEYDVRPIQTFISLAPSTDVNALSAKLPDAIERYMGAQIRKMNDYHLQPLTRMHLYEYEDYGMQLIAFPDYGMPISSDITTVYLLITVAIFILIIACINFMNLSTARSVHRAREVGIRKVVGANRTSLIRQFISESMLLSFLALLLAVLLIRIVLPTFNNFSGRLLDFTDIFHGLMPLYLIALTLFTGLLAGSYPAFYLSAFQPIVVMKGLSTNQAKGAWLRKGLVVFQFAASVMLIIGTTVIYEQLAFMRNKKLGFDGSQIITVPIFVTDRVTRPRDGNRLSFRYNMAKEVFEQHPNILKTTAFRFKLGQGEEFIRTVQPEGFPPNTWRMPTNEVDEDFFETFGLNLVAGRNFSPDIESDRFNAYILNETAVKQLGWDDPIDKSFTFNSNPGKVIGVVQDFHNRSLREEIGPVVFIMRSSLYHHLGVKLKPENFSETLVHLEKSWKQFLPNRPFGFEFEEQRLTDLYAAEIQLGNLVQLFAGLAIFVACLGLFGLASFIAEQRTKEIGVRKVLGATLSQIIVLMSREFIALIFIANIIAWPLAYVAMNQWLADFTYRMGLHPWIFFAGSGITFTIALFTLGYQAYKSAQANPVDALKYE